MLGGCSTDTFGADGGGSDASPSSDAGAEADANASDAIGTTDSPGSGGDAFSCPFFGSPTEPAGCSMCSLGPACCVDPDAGTGVCNSTGACLNAGSDLWHCFQPSDCGGTAGSYCCLDRLPKDLIQCPHSINPPATTSCSSGTCYRLCTMESDCNGTTAPTHCSKVDFGNVVQVGVCL